MPQALLKTRWPFIIFAVAVLLAIQIMVTVNYFYQDQIDQAENKVDKTEEALFLQHDFSQILQRTFLNQRSFVITGDESFHENYLSLLPQLSEKLEDTISVSGMSAKDADNLRTQHKELIRFMNESIQRRQIYGDKIPVITARAKESFRRISSLDETITAYMKQERSSLSSYKQQQQKQQLSYNQGMVAAAILSSFFLGALGYLLLKQQQRENVTQADLKTTKERLDLAIQGANDGVWDWDLITNDLYMSPRLKELIGYTNDEMPNALKAFDLLLHTQDRDRVWSEVYDYLDKKTDKFESTFRLRHKNGSWCWIMSRAQALWNEENNKAYRMIGTHTDVTSMKAMEEKLNLAREAAEEANQTKTDFISHISHEIRTPLNAVIGISRILTLSKPLTENFRDHVNALHTGAKNLQFLINDLLDLSRLDQGSLVLEHRIFSLRTMTEENIDLHRYHASEKGLALHFNTNVPADAMYQGDSLRLGQIVNNLLGNAIKFTDSGSVHITLNRTSDPNSTTDTVMLTVEDTGIGIPADKLDRIFDKFAQGDSSIARRYGGTGLGLSICHELCDLMNATINVHSIEGQGSEFVVTINLLRAESAENAANQKNEVAPQALHSVRKVLLVEDYQPNVFVAEALLDSIGFTCDSVTTGAEALHILNSPKRQDYMAALLDLQLPDMNGYMIAEETRAYEAQQGMPTLPLIAMTAHTSKAHQDRCMISGMNDYLVKPIDVAELEKILLQYLPAEKQIQSQPKAA